MAAYHEPPFGMIAVVVSVAPLEILVSVFTGGQQMIGDATHHLDHAPQLEAQESPICGKRAGKAGGGQ